jgi:hypothetical protein
LYQTVAPNLGSLRSVSGFNDLSSSAAVIAVVHPVEVIEQLTGQNRLDPLDVHVSSNTDSASQRCGIGSQGMSENGTSSSQTSQSSNSPAPA